MQMNHIECARDPSLVARQQAGRQAMRTLMNCYCREVAGPRGQLRVSRPGADDDWPQPIRMASQQDGGQVMQVALPATGARIVTVVEDASATANYRYRSSFYCKAPGSHWSPVEADALPHLLLGELGSQTGTGFNDELMHQIRDSVTVTAAVVEAAREAAFPDEPLAAYIASEQSLTYGHPFHPAPKSRQGVAHEDMLRYSPELGASFPLHYFAVRRDYLLQRSLLAQSCDEVVAGAAPAGLLPDDEHVLVPTHPWQARYLIAHPEVAAALRSGRLRDLGPQGDAYAPTSSIRTLFNPDNPYFYKCSLNIRITNCVRKNAVYELEGALHVTKLMRAVLPELRLRFPGVEVMEEPAFMSVDLKLEDAARAREVTEGFGMILREGFGATLLPGATPLLAGALFGNGRTGEARVRELLARASSGSPLGAAEAAERWFARYVRQTMYPVLYCYFAHGLVFEPHLQNVVLGVAGGEVRQVFLRDFEGVKLVRERHDAASLGDVSEAARTALWYSQDLGWQRVAYCLFVNNFCEAISQLGAGDAPLQARLWRVVRHALEAYQREHGDEASAGRIAALLAGEPLPGKTNLLNRFFKRADRASTYVPVINPMGPAAAPVEDAWN